MGSLRSGVGWALAALLPALVPVPSGGAGGLQLASVHWGLSGPDGGPQAYSEIVDGHSKLGRAALSRWVSLGCFQADPGLELEVVTTVTTTSSTITTTLDDNATTSTATSSTTTSRTTVTTTSTVTSTLTTTAANCSNSSNSSNATGCANTTALTEEEKLAAAIAAAYGMRSTTTPTTTTTLPATMDPAQCSRICEGMKYPLAAVRGMECFCLKHRIGFSVAVEAKCGIACPVQYFNATAKFCGGADDHYSLYQEYDFMHSGGQGCFDPWRRVWYQSVAVERFTVEKGRLIFDGYEWFLQAASVETGDPLFPYNRPLDNMLYGLHYDLDASRIVGLSLPLWAGKMKTDKFEPSILTVYMNSLRPHNVTFSVAEVVVDLTDPALAALPEWLAVPPGLDFMTSSSATAFDTTNNVYYLTAPDVPISGYVNLDRNRPIYEYTSFNVRIIGINLNTGITNNVILNRPLPFRVGVLEVNSAYHELLALVLNGATDLWSYISLGRSNRSEDGGPTVDFEWTFRDLVQAEVGNSTDFEEKTCQAGSTAMDHWSHTALFTVKASSNQDEPLEVADVRTDGSEGPGLAEQTGLAALVPRQAHAAWIMNLAPIVPWLPYPTAIDARFSMDGLQVFVKWPAYTYAGIQPVDLDGDTVPDTIDWSKRHLGPQSCVSMFAFHTALRLGPKSWCQWAEDVLPYSTITINMPTVDTLFLGDTLVFVNNTILTYLPYTGQLSLFSIDQVPVDKPDPVLPPVIHVNWKASSTPFAPISVGELTTDEGSIGTAALCQRGELNSDASYHHGGMPKWFWSLEAVACSTITGVDFEPNEFLMDEIRRRLAEGTVDGASGPDGHHIVQLPRDELEPGCVYKISVRLLGRWGKESSMPVQVTKSPPMGAINWMPDCPYFCNPATCEPPSTCVEGVCVCAPNLFGTFCSGICPTCSPRGSLGCDDGRFGSGKCICRVGYDGDLCRQRLEFRDHEFGPCEGECNSPVGYRTRIIKCTNVETEAIVDSSRCPPAPPPATVACVPKLCDCGPPPPIPGVNATEAAAACPMTLSGRTCEVQCGLGYTTLGLFRCYAGSYVEVPICSPSGGRMESLPALTVVMRVDVDAAAAEDPQAYMEANMGPQLRETFVEYLRERGVPGVTPSAVTLLAALVAPRTRRLLGAPGPTTPAPAPALESAGAAAERDGGGERRLQSQPLEITVLVALRSMEAMRLAEGAMEGLATNPAWVSQRLAEKLGKAGLPVPGGLVISSPVRSQVYVSPNSTLLEELPAPAAGTTGQPDDVELAGELKSGPLSVPAGSSEEWAVGLSIGFGAGALCLGVLCGTCFLWHQRKRKDAAEITSVTIKPDTVSSEEEERAVVAIADATAIVAHGSGPAPAPPPGRSPRTEPGPAQPSSPLALQESMPPRPDGREPEPHETGDIVPDGEAILFRGAGGGLLRSASLTLDDDGRVHTGLVEWQWVDGTIYKGQVAEGTLHGEGRILWPNGKTYIGQWAQGKFHGHGLLRATTDKGWAYNGQFETGECHGLGRCEWVSRGVWYDGEWAHGWQSGIGEAGSIRNLAWSTRGALPPLKCHFYQMERGERQENLGASKIACDLSAMVSVELTATEHDVERAVTLQARLQEAHGSELQLVSALWGWALGEPEEWIASRWGAVMLTRILPGGLLEKWNQAQDPRKQVLPNSLIWRVNGIHGEPRRMAQELLAREGRRKIAIEVQLPPSTRFSKLKDRRSKRRSWGLQSSSPFPKPWLRSGGEASPSSGGDGGELRRASQARASQAQGAGTLRRASQAMLVDASVSGLQRASQAREPVLRGAPGTGTGGLRRDSQASVLSGGGSAIPLPGQAPGGRLRLQPLDPAPVPPQVSFSPPGRPAAPPSEFGATGPSAMVAVAGARQQPAPAAQGRRPLPPGRVPPLPAGPMGR